MLNQKKEKQNSGPTLNDNNIAQSICHTACYFLKIIFYGVDCFHELRICECMCCEPAASSERIIYQDNIRICEEDDWRLSGLRALLKKV